VNSMKSISLLWAVISIIAVTAHAGDSPAVYSQSYEILIKGALAGSETVTETKSASGDLISSSEHEIVVSDGLDTKRMTFSTKMILAKNSWNPISYAYRYTSGGTGDFYDVAVKDAQIVRVLSRGGHTNESILPLPPNMVLVDFNVYHHYEYLVRKYDAKKGGRQIFANYVPLIGNDIPIAVTYLGDADIPTEKSPLHTKNFKVEIIGVLGSSLFVDKDGRLVRLLIPAQDLEVWRKDFAGTDKD
jgi:hypothetical protein